MEITTGKARENASDYEKALKQEIDELRRKLADAERARDIHHQRCQGAENDVVRLKDLFVEVLVRVLSQRD